jgi:PhzF family phenazine biosynthesis protein
MRAHVFQIDAFTRTLFSGNPAAVVLLPAFLPDRLLQAVAEENNLAETAFVVAAGGDYRLRWFTPTVEVPLCGHATLASAAMILERLEPNRNEVVFHTASGALTVRRSGAGYVMDFPSRPCSDIQAPEGLDLALGATPRETVWDGSNYLVRLDTPDQVRDLAPDLAAIARFDSAGVIVTAEGGRPFDFTSRYFAPAKGIPEDPVTGGAHCALAPFWAERLGRTEFRAFQASRRGGEVVCRLVGERVELEGGCVFYLEGGITLEDA